MSSTEDPPSLITTAVVVVAAVFPVLALLSIVLRYRARRIGRLPLQADDWCIAGTWIVTFALSINAWVFGSQMGINHYKINPLMGESKAAQCLWIGSLFLQVCLTTVKISILFFYKRIFSAGKFKYAAWAAIGLITVWGLLFFLLVIFQVDPVSDAWTGKGHFTVNATAFGLAQAGTSLCLDVLVLVLPLPVLSQLHMKTERKVAVGIILWLGGFCVVAAIVRLVLLHQALSTVVDSASSGFSQISVESKAYIFTIVEPNCSIIAASLPCFGPLFAGWRAPESLVASVRSTLSIGSHGSNHSTPRDRSSPRNASGSNEISPQYASKSAGQHGSLSESQIELNKLPSASGKDSFSVNGQEWSTANVESVPQRSEDAAGANGPHAIAVTRTYDTRQEPV